MRPRALELIYVVCAEAKDFILHFNVKEPILYESSFL